MYTTLVESLLETAADMVPNITAAELAIAATAWLRIQLDGEPEGRVISWARGMLGFETGPGDVLRMREGGASLRQISRATGISKSKVARLVSDALMPDP